MELAAKEAPRLPADDEARAAFMLGLQVADLELERPAEQATFNRLLREAGVLRDGLMAADVPTDRAITPRPPDTVALNNTPIPGWYLTELTGSPEYYATRTEKRWKPVPAMLGEDALVYTYVRFPGRNVDGYVDHRYVFETSGPANNAALAMAYAFRIAEHHLELPPIMPV